MAHFAEINKNNIVEQVIVIEQEMIDTGLWGDPNSFVETPKRNGAVIGSTYDKDQNIFIPVKPYDSWIFNKEICLWESLVPIPDDGRPYSWNEEEKKWNLIIRNI